MNIRKVNLTIILISMPFCLLADIADPIPSIDLYRIRGTLLCVVATLLCFLWTFLELAITLLEAFKKKTYNELHAHLKKILILAVVMCIWGVVLHAFRYWHEKEKKSDSPYHPPREYEEYIHTLTHPNS